MQRTAREKERTREDDWKTPHPRGYKGAPALKEAGERLCVSLPSLSLLPLLLLLLDTFIHLSLFTLLHLGEKEKRNGVKELSGVGSWL